MKSSRVMALTGLVVLGLLVSCSSVWAARVYIDIDQPFAKKIPVAVPDFVGLAGGGGGPGDVTQALPKRLGDNLDMTGMFIPLDKRTFLESGGRVDQIDFKQWKTIGSELLVKGGFELSGDSLTLEMRLYDVFEGKMLLGKRYTGARKDGRKMVNRFTNAMLKLLTGEDGIFGTQIAFVSGSGIMMAEFGGDEAVGVAGGGGPCMMPAVSPSGSVAYIQRQGKSFALMVGGQVISAGPLHVSPAFTPSGGLLAAISGKNDTNIFMFSGPGAKPVQVTNHYGINISPAVSPDGAQMAFISDRGGSPAVYVGPLGGGPARRVSGSGRCTDPAWSPRGDRIAYCIGDSDVVTVSPDGGDVQQLTGGQGWNLRPTFSPDGRMIAFSSNRLGRAQIFVMTSNGDRQQPMMPDFNGDQQEPYWSPAKPDGG